MNRYQDSFHIPSAQGTAKHALCVTHSSNILFPRQIFRSLIRKHVFDQEKYNCWATFPLLGFSDYPELQAPLFLVFLAIYNFSIAGNLGMMVIIKVNLKLHTPVYFFLSHLSFVDFCYSSIIAPKMPVNLLAEDRAFHFGDVRCSSFSFAPLW